MNVTRNHIKASLIVIGLICFGIWSALRVRQSLHEGWNISPIAVTVADSCGDRAQGSFLVEAESPWGNRVQLVESGDQWVLCSKSRIAVTKFIVTQNGPTSTSDIVIRYSQQAEAEDRPLDLLYAGKWKGTRLEKADASRGDSGEVWQASPISGSHSLLSLGRRSMNWKGDLCLVGVSASKPFVLVLFPAICFYVFLKWNRSMERREMATTSQKKSDDRVGGLDALRGIAILLVFLYHCLFASFGFDQLEWSGIFRDFNSSITFLALLPLTLGWCGVSIFFVISGFCIHLAWMRSSSGSWWEFFIRRFYRIAPPYWVALGFFAFYFPATRIWFDSPGSLWQAVSHFLFLHNTSWGTFYGTNGSFWSIAVEAQLYLIYPLLVFGASRIGWKWMMAVTALIEISIRSVGLFSYLGISYKVPFILSESPLGYWFSWSLGAYVAQMSLSKKSVFAGGAANWLFPAAGILCWFVKPLAPYSFIFASLSTAVVLHHLVNNPTCFRMNAWRIAGHMSRLGTISYSFYLLHQPILNFLPNLFREALPGIKAYPLALYVSCLCLYPVIFGISYLAYRWVELPAVEAGKRMLARSRNAHAAKQLTVK